MRLGVLACVPLAALLSCGGGGAGPSPGQDIATGDAASTDGEAVGSDPSAPGDPTTEASADPAADGVADLDADAEATQPGAPWTECEANEDCLSGFCLWHLGRKVCTQACMESESCPKGWTCGQVLNTAGDVFYVCVSRFFSLCRPCTAASDCAGAAGEAGECVRYLRPGAGSTDFFCGATCATEADCPTGYECLQEVGISGKASWQCVSATRECVCTEGYSTLLLASHCTRTNGWGTCEGTRRCEDGALTGCSAAEPAPETCDGVDEDCDGVPDDGLPGCCECGNGKPEDYCGAQKNPLVCPEDYLQDCGDRACAFPESVVNCPEDCCACDDGYCDRFACGEDADACAPDCGAAACGNKTCDVGENPSLCLEDCKWQACGNHVCEGSESPAACPEDCADSCGNCECEGAERYACPKDCGVCGDGTCSNCPQYEEMLYCGIDCGAGVEVCDGWDNDQDSDTDEENATGCHVFHLDRDGDSFGDPLAAKCLCGDSDGWTAIKAGDCDDLDPLRHPGTEDACNGKDDDCDGTVDPVAARGCTLHYKDLDHDGFGDDVVPALCLCGPDPVSGFTATRAGDCADADPLRHPGVPEVCDGVDEDCDGLTDEDAPGGGETCDVPGEHGICKPGVTGCAGKEIRCLRVVDPAPETCDGRDEDCDGKIDEEGADGCTDLYKDADGDGWGSAMKPMLCLCAPDVALDYTAIVGGDCNDTNAAVNPAAVERCNGWDDDCNGFADAADGEALLANDGRPCERQDGVCEGASKPVGLCSAGQWQACTAAVYRAFSPAYEHGGETSCDGLDNDCDGPADDDVAVVAGCTDNLDCTADACTDGECVHVVQADRCAVAGRCHTRDAVNPDEPCEQCKPDLAATDWSARDPVGTCAGDECMELEHRVACGKPLFVVPDAARPGESLLAPEPVWSGAPTGRCMARRCHGMEWTPWLPAGVSGGMAAAGDVADLPGGRTIRWSLGGGFGGW